MTCESCGDKPKKCNKDFTKAVIEIENPEQTTLMRKVTIPASMGDDTTVPPVVGKHHNVLLYYEANHKSYLYSSDGIPTLLANGLTDYEEAVNLPQINGVTLIGNKTSGQLGLQPTLSVTPDTGIKLEDNELSGLPATDTTIGMVKPGDGLEVSSDGTLSVRNADGYVYVFDSIAELRASTDLHPGSLVRTLGYYEPNDGGGSWFMVRAKEDGDVDDAATTIIVGDIAAKIIIGSEISYDQFGALGDGETDDYTYIKNTHIFANGKNLTVIANPEKTYYIKNITSQIPVMTNIDWKGAHFIIDDSGTPTQHHLFDVIPTEGIFDYTGEIASLYKGQSSCELKGHGNLLVRLTNSNKKDFIRIGGNANQGSDRREYVRIDNDGRILDTLYFQFDQITNILAKKLDEPFITIKNGIFKNIVNTVDSYNYYGRGIMVHRCNVIVEKIDHTVEGEDDTETSSPYTGFICSSFCANLTIKDCNVTAHKQFYTQDNVAKGSYDIDNEGTVGLLVENVHQTNDICNNALWSVHGSNYCRECTFKNSTLSKIDAHKGVYNLYVDNCVVGSRGIGCCGAGKIIIKNTVVNRYNFLYLRGDYGAWFDGTIEIYNSQLNNNETRNKYLLIAEKDVQNVGDDIDAHDFGYVCKLPSLKVENFVFNCNNTSQRCIIYRFIPGDRINYLASYEDNAANNCYPQVFDGNIEIKNINVMNHSGNNFIISLFNTEIEKLYVEKTGTAPNRFANSHKNGGSYQVNNPNKPNVYIYTENCAFTSDNFDFITGDGRTYSPTQCSLWPDVYLFKTDEAFVNTHRPVLDITIKRSNNLYLGLAGRAITLHLEDSEVRQLNGLVSNNDPYHTLYVIAKNCKFRVKQLNVDPNTTNDPGWIFPYTFTYHFEDCHFDNQTWGIDQGGTINNEAFLFTVRKQNNVMTSVVTNINPSYAYNIEDISNVSDMQDSIKYYGVQTNDVLNSIAGKITLRKSGASQNAPGASTAGIITNYAGVYTVPIGAQYYNNSNNTWLTFNGTAWV